MYTCPCCGFETFESPPCSYDICPICFWEDDGFQLYFPFQQGGANKSSLVQAQVAFIQFGACERRLIDHARSPLATERKDPLWFPLWELRVPMPDEESSSASPSKETSVKALCYWLRSPKPQS